MMLFLTGAPSSLAKSWENPQANASESLGGYVSSTVVPNSAMNTLFDLISTYTLEKRQRETIALGLINTFDQDVKDLEIKVVVNDSTQASYKIAAVAMKEDYLMESIANRYQSPMNAEFHSANFHRASVDFIIERPAIEGEEIAFFPFNVNVEVKGTGIDATCEAIEEAFSNSDLYIAKRISSQRMRIEARDEEVIEEPRKCSYVKTDNFLAKFVGDFRNKETNSLFLAEDFKSKQGIGLWIQREIKPGKYLDNLALIENYKEGYILPSVEEIEIIISYKLPNE